MTMGLTTATSAPFLPLLIIVCSVAALDDDGACVSDVPAITLARLGQAAQGRGMQVLVPSYNFSCSGLITGVTIGADARSGDGGFVFQIWRPQGDGICNLQHSVNVSQSIQIQRVGDQLSFNTSIPVLPGDLIGYRLEPVGGGNEITFLLDKSNASNIVIHRRTSSDRVCRFSQCDSSGDQKLEYGFAPHISIQFADDIGSSEQEEETGDEDELLCVPVDVPPCATGPPPPPSSPSPPPPTPTTPTPTDSPTTTTTTEEGDGGSETLLRLSLTRETIIVLAIGVLLFIILVLLVVILVACICRKKKPKQYRFKNPPPGTIVGTPVTTIPLVTHSTTRANGAAAGSDEMYINSAMQTPLVNGTRGNGAAVLDSSADPLSPSDHHHHEVDNTHRGRRMKSPLLPESPREPLPPVPLGKTGHSRRVARSPRDTPQTKKALLAPSSASSSVSPRSGSIPPSVPPSALPATVPPPAAIALQRAALAISSMSSLATDSHTPHHSPAPSTTLSLAPSTHSAKTPSLPSLISQPPSTSPSLQPSPSPSHLLPPSPSHPPPTSHRHYPPPSPSHPNRPFPQPTPSIAVTVDSNDTHTAAPPPPPISQHTNTWKNTDSRYDHLVSSGRTDTADDSKPCVKPRPDTGSNSRSSKYVYTYVPTEDQRRLIKIHKAGHYETTEELAEEVKGYDRLKFFKESETYWSPANTTSGLYAQLYENKYRELPREQIIIHGQVGSGHFGSVSKGVWQLCGEDGELVEGLQVAVKVVRTDAEEVQRVKLLQESAIMGQFAHPNVVRLHGVVTVGDPIMMVLEYMPQGDLKSYLHRMRPAVSRRPVPREAPRLFVKFGKDIAAGMSYLARKNFIHRDLATRNILLSHNFTCKIGDFGMARDIAGSGGGSDYYKSHGGIIPVKWTAPESLNYNKYTSASDVWSYGMVLFEIWSLGYKPFHELANPIVIALVTSKHCQAPPPGCPRPIYHLMVECWNPKDTQRPTFDCIQTYLDSPDDSLLQWCPGDVLPGKQAHLLGAPLVEGNNLYIDLQRTYQNQLLAQLQYMI